MISNEESRADAATSGVAVAPDVAADVAPAPPGVVGEVLAECGGAADWAAP